MRQQTIDLLQSHNDLIAHIANSFAETTQFDPEELISFGRSVLVSQAKKWDPARGKFSTFLYWLLRSSFTDYIHKQRKEVYVDVYEDVIEAPASYSPLPTNVADLLAGVSSDAASLVQVALDSEWDEEWKNLGDRLKKAMLGMGWDEVRYVSAYNEVSGLVKEW